MTTSCEQASMQIRWERDGYTAAPGWEFIQLIGPGLRTREYIGQVVGGAYETMEQDTEHSRILTPE